jgi:hypothetical protein
MISDTSQPASPPGQFKAVEIEDALLNRGCFEAVWKARRWLFSWDEEVTGIYGWKQPAEETRRADAGPFGSAASLDEKEETLAAVEIADFLNAPVSPPAPEYGQAVIQNGEVIIRIPIATLPLAMSGACDLQAIEPRYEVTDAELFARALVRELNKDDEQGTTRIHRMLDAAMNEAIEQGAEGVSEPIDEWEEK